jgi:hypothetical protein
MAASATAIAEPFSPTTATVSQPSGTASAGATVTSGGGSFTSYSSSGTTGGATATTSTGSSTATLTCSNCCSCGGHLLSLFGPSGYCPGLADTSAPIELTITYTSTPRAAYSYLGTKTVSVKGTSNLSWPSSIVGNCNYYNGLALVDELGYSPSFCYPSSCQNPSYRGTHISFDNSYPPKAFASSGYQSYTYANGPTWFGIQAPFYSGGGYSYDNITLTIGVVPTGPSLNFYFPTPVAPTSHSCSPFSLTYSGEIYYVSYRTIIGIPNITKGNVIADVTATVTF